MAWRNDLSGFIRGLEYITRALIETQGKEATKAWRNSSVRTAVERAGTRAQESAGNMATGGGEVQVGFVAT